MKAHFHPSDGVPAFGGGMGVYPENTLPLKGNTKQGYERANFAAPEHSAAAYDAIFSSTMTLYPRASIRLTALFKTAADLRLSK